jgi:hypothetical protein
MKASTFRSAALERDGRETGEVILVMTSKEIRELAEAVAAGAKANPRKRTWKRLLAGLEGCPAWSF